MKIEDIERDLLDKEALHDALKLGDKSELFRTIAAAVGETVATKNAAYGDAFAKAGAFLKLAFPEKIPPEQYEDMLGIVRVFDKLMRIATDKQALNEDPWKDIAGYGVLGVAAQKLQETNVGLFITKRRSSAGTYDLRLFHRTGNGSVWVMDQSHGPALSLTDAALRDEYEPYDEVAKKLFAKSP